MGQSSLKHIVRVCLPPHFILPCKHLTRSCFGDYNLNMCTLNASHHRYVQLSTPFKMSGPSGHKWYCSMKIPVWPLKIISTVVESCEKTVFAGEKRHEAAERLRAAAISFSFLHEKCLHGRKGLKLCLFGRKKSRSSVTK